jgi:hypothetical protein
MDLIPKQKAKLFNTPKDKLLNPHIGKIAEPKFGDLDVVYDYVNKKWIIGVRK